MLNNAVLRQNQSLQPSLQHHHQLTPLLQIAFACALSAVVATQLDNQPTSPYCFLNVSGQVCTFTYITTGAVLLITLSILIPVSIYSIRKKYPLHDVYLPLQLFLLFWVMVMSITITGRGNWATGSGVPYTTSRNTVIAFGWILFAFNVILCGILAADLYIQRKAAARIAAMYDEDKKAEDEFVVKKESEYGTHAV